MSAVRVLVCFKVTPDFEELPEADWAAAATHGVQTRYVRRVLNCFDESALELALRLSDTLATRGQTVDLGALSIGGREVEPYLTTLVALGYERATRVVPEADAAGAGPADAGADANADAAPTVADAGFELAPAAVAAIVAAPCAAPITATCSCSAAGAGPATAARCPSGSPRRWAGRA